MTAFIAFPRPEYILASLVMLLWPLFCLLLFTWFPRHRAVIACYLLGVLCLPPANGFVIAGLPHFTRKTLPAVGVLFAALLVNKWPWAGAKLDRFTTAMLGLIFLSNFPRVWANTDPMVFPNTVVPGLTPYWLVTFALQDLFTLVVPLLIGLGLGSGLQRTRDMIEVWLKIGVCYMVLAAIEVRLSPQINTWVYGYFQHSFGQMMRDGGFRPIVFLEHALELALFTATCLLLAAIGGRARLRVWGVPSGVLVWVFVLMLIGCKSLGAMFLGSLGLLLLYLGSMGLRATVAKWTAVVVLTLPMTRLLDWAPTDALIDFFRDIDPDRANSLWFRLTNEDTMLTKVSQRLWTGWGGFDRIQAYDEYGTKMSVLDGSWVIELLSGGLPRFIGVFGLLTWPIFKAARLVRKLPNGDRKQLLSGLALVASFVVLDLVPNSFFNYLSALICGVVLGLCRITDEVSSAHSYARTSHPALPSRSALPDHT